MTLTDPDDPKVLDALTRKCSIGGCRAAVGIPCVCELHGPMPHMLAECPTRTGRIVHEARLQPVPKGGD